MSVVIDISADTSRAEERLMRIKRAFDRQTFLTLVGQRLLAWVDENFRKAGAETPWDALSANTVARRGAGAQPLRDTGRLAMSFVSRVSGDEVWVGTEDQKAAWHHFGTLPYTITTKPPTRSARKVTTHRKGKALDRPYSAAGALVFMTPNGPVFRRSVNHPGLAARPLLPSRSLAQRLAGEELNAYVEAVANGAG